MKVSGGSHQCCSCDNEVLIDISYCTVDNDVGTGEFSLMLGILHVCGYTHVSPSMNFIIAFACLWQWAQGFSVIPCSLWNLIVVHC